jgi:hypothetical protein
MQHGKQKMNLKMVRRPIMGRKREKPPCANKEVRYRENAKGEESRLYII